MLLPKCLFSGSVWNIMFPTSNHAMYAYFVRENVALLQT
ncbi:hypothetical protein WN943_026771 [Citrus x changshan-huyou]